MERGLLPDDRRIGAILTPTVRLAAAGLVATAIAFGPARMGFGWFLPDFRDAFALSTSLAGLVASGGFLAFLLKLPIAAWLGARVGQRAPVMAGTLSAMAGFAVVATASDSAALAAGIALAGVSAGFCWAPFNDAVARVVPEGPRSGAVSAVATGTTAGVTAAATFALVVSAGARDWRMAWSAFAPAGLVAAFAVAIGVPLYAAKHLRASTLRRSCVAKRCRSTAPHLSSEQRTPSTCPLPPAVSRPRAALPGCRTRRRRR